MANHENLDLLSVKRDKRQVKVDNRSWWFVSAIKLASLVIIVALSGDRFVVTTKTKRAVTGNL